MASFEELLTLKPTLAEVCEYARASKWFQLGIQLELDERDLEDIQGESYSGDERRTKVYQLWFRTQPKATRRQLLTALRSVSVGESNRAAIEYEEMLRKKASPTTSVETNESVLTRTNHEATHNVPLLDTILSDKHICNIAQEMIRWENIPLELTQSEIEAIQQNYRNDYHQQKIQSLYKWRQKKGSIATYRNLIITLSPQSKELVTHIMTLIGEKEMSSIVESEKDARKEIHWDDSISDVMISNIGVAMVTWDDIATALGLTQAEQVVIQRNYSGDYERQKKQVLFKWREKVGPSVATYSNLVKLLTECGENNLVEYVTESIKSFK